MINETSIQTLSLLYKSSSYVNLNSDEDIEVNKNPKWLRYMPRLRWKVCEDLRPQDNDLLNRLENNNMVSGSLNPTVPVDVSLSRRRLSKTKDSSNPFSPTFRKSREDRRYCPYATKARSNTRSLKAFMTEEQILKSVIDASTQLTCCRI